MKYCINHPFFAVSDKLGMFFTLHIYYINYALINMWQDVCRVLVSVKFNLAFVRPETVLKMGIFKERS